MRLLTDKSSKTTGILSVVDLCPYVAFRLGRIVIGSGVIIQFLQSLQCSLLATISQAILLSNSQNCSNRCMFAVPA